MRLGLCSFQIGLLLIINMNVKQINSISIFFARSAKYTTDAKKMIGTFTVLMINPVSPGKSPILNKIIVMAEQLYVHASADRHRV